MCGVVYADACFANGSFCRKTSDGKVVCNYINTGGEVEYYLCYKAKSESPNNPDTNVWESDDDWWVKKVGQDCTNGKPGAKTAKCILNYDRSYDYYYRSCAAYECLSGYLLYTTNRRREIDVVGKNQKVGSQGLCRSKSYLKGLCDAGCGCNDKEECVLNEVTVKNHGKDVKAFIGEEMCVCVAKNNAAPAANTTNCTYTFKVLCDDGKTEVTGLDGYPITVNYTQEGLKEVQDTYKLTDDEITQCTGDKILTKADDLYKKMWGKDKAEFDDKLKKSAELNKYIIDFCANYKGYTGVANGTNITYVQMTNVNSAAISDARSKISAFMTSADANRSAWKNADGKFNSMRLASDISAGVVLGTVGGVVSGVVIKKKQLEKGFDVLHCSVGGQTIADWGDEFSVGLR